MRETPNYKLPQIDSTDNFDIEDFNKAWLLTDTELKNTRDEFDDKVEELELSKENIEQTVGEVKDDYESLKRVIIDENASADLQNQINQTNSSLETNTNDIIGVSVKNFGAIGDGVTDDTEAIKNALSSNAKIITMDCDCKISDSLILPTNKSYDFRGSFIIDDNFKGNYVISISDLQTELELNKISIIHKKFYKNDKHMVTNTVRTKFDGLVITNTRKLHIKLVEIIGISSRPLVVNGGYETHIDKIDLWGSNLSDVVSVNTIYDDKLLFGSQLERYTVGAVLNCDDGIFNNMVCVGFNVGASINSCNSVLNYHPWGYISSMLYGLVVKGSQNICGNLYFDTVKPIGSRSGAGLYEWKIADGNTTTNGVEYNKYNNITAIKFDSNAYIVEMGDIARVNTSYGSIVGNIAGQYDTKNYKLIGNAKGNPLLSKLYGENFGIFATNINNLVYTSSNTFADIIKEIINNHFQTNYNFMSSMTFIDDNMILTSKLPQTNGLYNQKAIFKIEGYNKRYFRCTVQGYGFPNSNTYVLDLFRQDNGTFDTFSNYENKYRIQSWLPTASEFGVGAQIFYKDKPIWKSSAGYWVDATGTQVY